MALIPDGNDLSLGQPRRRIARPDSVGVSPRSTLGLAVGHIVFVSSWPQMKGVTASAVIARMTDKQSRRDRAVSEDIRNSVGKAKRSLKHDLPISRGFRAFLPVPARIKVVENIHAGPEVIRLSRGKIERKLIAHLRVPSCGVNAGAV